jgi:FtsP/CotA-like multicopper oxidase with cupredoxin domain
VPSVQQCPIPPKKSFTYNFKADLYGTSWYHSHYSAQYAGGLLGPMIIHGPKNVPYDIDLGPVFLTDYYHTEYFELVKNVMGSDFTKLVPFSDNNLINGKGNFNCSLVPAGTKCTPNAGLSKFKFTTGLKHRLRLINAGAEAIQKFSIDGHSLTVMAVDFVPVQPYTTFVYDLRIHRLTSAET